MSITTQTYERKMTGERSKDECCLEGGLARMSSPMTPNECLSRLLPRSKKQRVTFTDGIYTVPALMRDQVRGISHGNAQGNNNINILEFNDEGADVLYLIPGIVHELQVLSVYEADTTATDIYIHF
jgi:hypothetical protein